MPDKPAVQIFSIKSRQIMSRGIFLNPHPAHAGRAGDGYVVGLK